MDLSLSEILILCGCILLSVLLITEIFHLIKLIPLLGYTTSNDRSYDWKGLLDNKGHNQSPINIITRSAIVIKASHQLKWIGYSTQPMTMTIKNDGNTISIRGFWARGLRPCIEGGPLKSRYYLHSIVLNWGNADDSGSEHSFDNVKYPLEMQLIHVKEDYDSFDEALRSKNRDNIAIVSYLFEKAERNNVLLEPILSNLSRVQEVGTKVYITPIYMDTLFPLFESKYYSYNGSLTQPPHSEIVTWIIHDRPLAISSSQIDQLRKIHANDSIVCNSRSIQNLNNRNVFYYEEISYYE